MMKKATQTLFVFFALFLFLAACKETETKPGQAPGPDSQATAATPLTEDVEADIGSIDNLNTDLDSGELEDLDKELDSIDW